MSLDVHLGDAPPLAVTIGGPPAIGVTLGTTGPQGPQGPPGTSTPIIAVAFEDWPPVSPVANTLYLRLAP